MGGLDSGRIGQWEDWTVGGLDSVEKEFHLSNSIFFVLFFVVAGLTSSFPFFVLDLLDYVVSLMQSEISTQSSLGTPAHYACAFGTFPKRKLLSD